jgi:drug/metabolite transporter (DMT)-like permease
MTRPWLPIALTVAANLLYHVAQKSMPRQAPPLVPLAAVYVVALVATLVALPFTLGGQRLGTALRQLDWSSVAVGIAIVGVEVGFLLAYRSGWDLGTAAVTSTVCLALLLVPAGVMLYREPVTAARGLGILLCLLGLVLVHRT